MPLPDTNLLLQPIIGAAIGYVTNAVAIHMLFRPLRPWRIFGFRVPMTPGVIPAKRDQLARNIGEMVGGHLLTSSDIERAIREQGFQAELATLLDERVDTLLYHEHGALPTLIPERFKPYFHAGMKILRWRALRQVHAYIESEAFGEKLIKAVEVSAQPLLNCGIADPAGEKVREQVYAFIESVLAATLAEPWVEEWAASILQGWLNTVTSEGKSIADLLPEEATDFLLDRVAQQAPQLLEKLGHILHDPETIEKLAVWFAEAAKKLIASFGPMASLISGFLSPESIRRKIEEYLVNHGEDVQDLLLAEETREKLAILLKNKCNEWLHTPLAVVFRHVPLEKREQWFTWASSHLAHALRHPELAKAAMACLRQGIEADGSRTLKETLSHLLGAERCQDGAAWISGEILALVRSPSTKRILDDLIIDLVEHRLLKHPIGRLADLLPRDVRGSVSDFLFEQLSYILTREVPPLVDSLGIRSIVARKVDSLDLQRLEDLLMGIMKEQFKYINLFGGLLGFLIGLVNLIPLLLH